MHPAPVPSAPDAPHGVGEHHHQCRCPAFCEASFVNGLITHTKDVLRKEMEAQICAETEKDAEARIEAKVAVRVKEWVSTLSELAKTNDNQLLRKHVRTASAVTHSINHQPPFTLSRTHPRQTSESKRHPVTLSRSRSKRHPVTLSPSRRKH